MGKRRKTNMKTGDIVFETSSYGIPCRRTDERSNAAIVIVESGLELEVYEDELISEF